METMATKRKTSDDDTLTEQIGIRVSGADRARLEALAGRFPALSASAIARQALVLGMALIEEQPTVLLGEKPKRR